MGMPLPPPGSVGGPWGGTFLPEWMIQAFANLSPEQQANRFADYVQMNPKIDFGWYWNNYKDGAQYAGIRFGDLARPGVPDGDQQQTAIPPGGAPPPAGAPPPGTVPGDRGAGQGAPGGGVQPPTNTGGGNTTGQMNSPVSGGRQTGALQPPPNTGGVVINVGGGAPQANRNSTPRPASPFTSAATNRTATIGGGQKPVSGGPPMPPQGGGKPITPPGPAVPTPTLSTVRPPVANNVSQTDPLTPLKRKVGGFGSAYS